MRKYYPMILVGVVSILIIPSIALAAWWNPFTWFKKKPVEQPVAQIQPTAEIKKETEAVPAKKPAPAPAKTVSKPSPTYTAKTCRPEIAITQKVPTWAQGNLRGYFQNVIASNPPLNNLETIRTVLITYREQMIKSSSGQVVPDSILKDENGERIPFTAEQLDSIESSYGMLYSQAIDGYMQWIQLTNQLIADKSLDGCLDGRDLYDYM